MQWDKTINIRICKHRTLFNVTKEWASRSSCGGAKTGINQPSVSPAAESLRSRRVKQDLLMISMRKYPRVMMQHLWKMMNWKLNNLWTWGYASSNPYKSDLLIIPLPISMDSSYIRLIDYLKQIQHQVKIRITYFLNQR